MPRDYRLYLDDIIDAVKSIRNYIQEMDYADFVADKRTQDAVIRNLEVIGEAAGHLPESICAKASEVEWRKIIGLRNLLIHEYFGVSLPIVWDFVQTKIDPLARTCEELLDI